MIEVKRMGLLRYLLLSVLTFGLYNIWWVYKTWSFFQEKEKTDINPALRTIFSVIFLIPLFYKVQEKVLPNKYLRSLISILLFTGILFFSLMAYLPPPSTYICIVSLVFYILPFQAYKQLLDASEEVIVIEQSSFNWMQIILLLIGGALWALNLLAIILRMTGLM